MQEDLTKIRIDVLHRLRIERAEALLEVSKRPDDRSAQRRLQNLEDTIAALQSALKSEPRIPRYTTVD